MKRKSGEQGEKYPPVGLSDLQSSKAHYNLRAGERFNKKREREKYLLFPTLNQEGLILKIIVNVLVGLLFQRSSFLMEQPKGLLMMALALAI